MDVLGSTGQVELNLFRTQKDEERNVRALASGLRVVSASDDPSGLEIANTIQARVSGLQQGAQNVQAASNLLNAADATLAGVEGILTRIHTLIAQAASDLNSSGQLQAIQSEIDTLLLEINKISGAAKFNNIKLFDGSLATFSSAYNTTARVVQVKPFDSNSTGTNVYDATGSGSPNAGPLIYNAFYQQSGFVSGLTEFQVLSYSTNPVDPVVGPLGMPGDYVKITQYSSDPNFGGTNGATEQISTGALATGTGVNQGAGPGNPLYINNASGALSMLRFELANLSAQDAGVTMAFETFDPSSASTPTGQALQVNSNGTEGGIIQISLPSVSTSALGISSISILQPTAVDYENNVTGTTSNAAAAADAEARVSNAIDAISQVRATVGAQNVSLQEDANNASLETVNQLASESAIRDTNVAQASSDFIKDQVLTNIDISVTSQMQVDAQLVAQLVSRAATLPNLNQSSALG
ncbi:MAG: flagellin [Candidatus Baltobacteraceae bacterium]